MDIVIDIEDEEPLFSQLVTQVKAAVQGGKVRAGDALPSIRQLANDLELNSKTVAKAYRLLERDSVIQTRGYRGTFVHPDAKANSQVNLQGWLTKTLAETVATLRESGLTDSEIRIAFNQAMNARSHGAAKS
ncbi:MAG: GntR family transcriptional regulator [Rhodanobacter sp.]|nr:MAG: GntR family transcriptional regulator [Rhodanobacter sp.]